jgi:simple sugar transport system permease protein
MSALLNKLPASRKYRLAVYFIAGLAVVSLARILSSTSDLTSTGTIAAAAGLAVPIGLAGLGGIWSERAGVANIGLEGMMILGTFGAGWIGYQHGPWAGVLAAVILGGFGGLLFAIASVSFGVDQIIAGTAINILGLGITQFLARILFDGVEGGGQTQSPPVSELPTVSITAVAEPLSAIQEKGLFIVSDLAGLVSGFFFRMSVLTVLTIALFIFTAWLLWRTPFGLRTRSAGENPQAAESLGVNVYFYKYVAVTMSGLLAGLGGAYLAIVGTNVYREGQTAGRGFIGLATMIFGNWRPGGTAMGAGIFGYIDALQLRDDANVRGIVLLGGILLIGLAGYAIVKRRARLSFGLGLLGAGLLSAYLLTKELPAEVAMVAPYIVTLLVLATASQRLRAPAADGIPYRKGEAH